MKNKLMLVIFSLISLITVSCIKMNDLTPVVPEHKIKTISVPYYSPVPLNEKSTFKSMKLGETQSVDTIQIAEMDSIHKVGLIAYYPFNDSTKDESGNNLDGIIIKEDTTLNPTPYLFNSQEDSTFIRIADPDGKLKLRHSFSIALWYRNTELREIPQGIIGKARMPKDGVSAGSTYFLQLGQLYYNDNGADQNLPTLIFGINDGNDPNAKKEEVIYQNPVIIDGNWHFVVCTFEILSSGDAKLAIYFDEDKIYLRNHIIDVSASDLALPEDSNEHIYIGRDSKLPCDGNIYDEKYRYFYGGIDNIMIYNRVLTIDEMVALRDLRIK